MMDGTGDAVIFWGSRHCDDDYLDTVDIHFDVPMEESNFNELYENY